MAYDTEDFVKDVIERSHKTPVLVDFWAEWCGPCKVLGPILEKLAVQSKGQWTLAKLDTEKYPAIATQYEIRSIPNVKLFIDGQVRNEFVGALPEHAVSDWIHKAIPNKYHSQLEEARQFLREDKTVKARDILDPIVTEEPDNDEALVLLAQSLFSTNPRQALETVATINLGSEYYDVADAIRSIVALSDRIENSPLADDPVKDTYLNAVEDARSGNFEAALNGFIEGIRKNRYYDDDGGRKACIAVFRLLGEGHSTTKRFRPLLSNALY